MISDDTQTSDKTFLDRVLSLCADVRAGEGATAILLMVNLFFLLTAYLIVKTVREALILSEGGVEVKSYAAAGQALILLGAVPLYGYIASRVSRLRLINGVTIFFVINLALFYALAQLHVPLGVPFFLWVGVFNLLIIAQFWSFANDLYSEEEGKRLFAIVAIGGSAGATLGPKIASWLFESFGPYRLMLLTALLLCVATIFPNLVARRPKSRRNEKHAQVAEKPLGKEGGFFLIRRQPYLLFIAVLMILLNIVNTTGEFILGKKVTEEAQRVASTQLEGARPAAAGPETTQEDQRKKVQQYIGRFYGDFFFTVSLLSALAQLLLVSRAVKYFGVPGSLYFLPVISLTGYSLIAWLPLLATVQWTKIFENSTDYSLQNTARQALFLPTSREVKYKAKAAIDTFFVRCGDILSSLLVFASVQFSLGIQTLSMVNVALALLWLGLIFAIRRHYLKLTAPGTVRG